MTSPWWVDEIARADQAIRRAEERKAKMLKSANERPFRVVYYETYKSQRARYGYTVPQTNPYANSYFVIGRSSFKHERQAIAKSTLYRMKSTDNKAVLYKFNNENLVWEKYHDN